MTRTEARTAAKAPARSMLRKTRPRRSSPSWRPSEGQIQRSLVERWKLLGVPGSILAHIPNGGHREKAVAVELKALGVLAGMPDLLCASPGGGVFFIELKRHDGRTSVEQREIHERLRLAGADVFTVNGVDDAVALLEGRGVIRKSVDNFSNTA